MNPRLTYTPPTIDYVRRNYSSGVQDILVLMLQRDPQKRANLNVIVRLPLVEKISLQLNKEEAIFNQKK